MDFKVQLIQNKLIDFLGTDLSVSGRERLVSAFESHSVIIMMAIDYIRSMPNSVIINMLQSFVSLSDEDYRALVRKADGIREIIESVLMS
jgi:hypothetical protein